MADRDEQDKVAEPVEPPPAVETPPPVTAIAPVDPLANAVPMQGCLYCHTEGSVTAGEGRKILGFGSGLPILTCKQCGSVALFETRPDAQTWRIKYRRFNRDAQYYYSMVYLGMAGWLDESEALDISRRSYVQRKRINQAESGDLSFLHAEPLEMPPPLMAPDERVYIGLKPVILQQTSRAAQNDESGIQDSGMFYLTDRKIHLLGHRRDWSHKLSDIRDVEYTDRYWRIHVGNASQHYQGMNAPDQIDAQLVCAVVAVLRARA